MFNFLASKYRQPPEYNPQEEDEEDQFKSARSVFTSTLSSLHSFCLLYAQYYFFSLTYRRGTTTDMPLAVRFRLLKKTSRDTVGVYRYKPLLPFNFCYTCNQNQELLCKPCYLWQVCHTRPWSVL